MEVSEKERSWPLVCKLLGVQSSRQERQSTEKRVGTVFLNEWAANGEKQDEERCGQFWELSGKGEQRCSELSAVCLRDAEDSQIGQNCNSRTAGGTNLVEFKIG